MKDLRAASVQFQHHAGDKAANLAIMEAFVQQAARQQVDVIVFPEMCITGYWHVRHLSRTEVDALAEPVPEGPSCQRVRHLARQHGMTIAVGLIERAADGALYNTCLVAMPDGQAAQHRKLHCFISPHMASGDAFTVFDTPHGCRMGVLICYDNNLIENVRINALQGAEVLLAPHQTGGCASRSPRAMGRIDPRLWHERHQHPEALEAAFKGPKGRGWLMRWLPARAHDNGLYYIFSNGVGLDDDEVRTGNAMILDPYGEILAETWHAGDAMVVAGLEARWLPTSSGRRWLKARRPELYGPLTEPVGDEAAIRAVRFGEDPVP